MDLVRLEHDIESMSETASRLHEEITRLESELAKKRAELEFLSQKLSALHAEKQNDLALLGRENYYENVIAALLADEGLPLSRYPTDSDLIRTALVGVATLQKREDLGRAHLEAWKRVRNCRKALNEARKAEAQGVRLREDLSVRALTEQLAKLEPEEKEADAAYMAEDHRLCCEDYNAWRIANK